jgi:tRNA(Ile)-lysidine synthase
LKTSRTIRAAVLAFVREHDLLPPGPLVVAVSGGTDSVALLVLLSSLAPDLGLDLHVAHFDHRLRPRASAKDAAFVVDLAQHCGATIRIGRAERAPKSEDDARELRYAFLRRAAQETGAKLIATGHTRDDQAETVLLHATRGSGLAGLAGMRPKRDDIVRPLLTIGRTETAAICAAARIAPREDASNRDLAYARNRIRRRVLPELERINPQVRAALARLAEAAAEVADDRRDAAERALAAAMTDDRIDLAVLAGPHRDDALALAWHRATGRPLSARHRKALGSLVAVHDGSAALDLPGGQALREYGALRIRAAGVGVAPADPAEQLLDLDQPVDWGGWTIRLRATEPAGDVLAVRAPDTDLVVRSRRPGDRLAGRLRIKVQDLFTDAKVPARERATHPLVATAAGDVWWVVGLKRADAAVSGGRWIEARPPIGVEHAFRQRTGTIDSSGRVMADKRGQSHELR